jgi:hypothetical protein
MRNLPSGIVPSSSQTSRGAPLSGKGADKQWQLLSPPGWRPREHLLRVTMAHAFEGSALATCLREE